MAKVLISPSKYLQGAGEMKNIGTYAANCGKKALVLISKGGYKRIGKMIEDSFAASDCDVVFDYFNGECCNSEINRLVEIVKESAVTLPSVLAEARFLIQPRQWHTMPKHRCLSARPLLPQMHHAAHYLLYTQKTAFLKNTCSFLQIQIWCLWTQTLLRNHLFASQ